MKIFEMQYLNCAIITVQESQNGVLDFFNFLHEVRESKSKKNDWAQFLTKCPPTGSRGPKKIREMARKRGLGVWEIFYPFQA